MKHNYKPFLAFKLRQEMEWHRIAPNKSTRLQIDGKEHEYKARVKGKWQKISYDAHIDCFGQNLPILIANYGSQKGKRHSYTVSIYQLINK